MQRIIEILFSLSGAIVFWAEIASTLLGLVAAIYTSWKVSKLFMVNNGSPKLLSGNPVS